MVPLPEAKPKEKTVREERQENVPRGRSRESDVERKAVVSSLSGGSDGGWRMNRPVSCCGDGDVDDVGEGDGGCRDERNEREKKGDGDLRRTRNCVETSRSMRAVRVTLQRVAPREVRAEGVIK